MCCRLFDPKRGQVGPAPGWRHPKSGQFRPNLGSVDNVRAASEYNLGDLDQIWAHSIKCGAISAESGLLRRAPGWCRPNSELLRPNRGGFGQIRCGFGTTRGCVHPMWGVQPELGLLPTHLRHHFDQVGARLRPKLRRSRAACNKSHCRFKCAAPKLRRLPSGSTAHVPERACTCALTCVLHADPKNAPEPTSSRIGGLSANPRFKRHQQMPNLFRVAQDMCCLAFFPPRSGLLAKVRHFAHNIAQTCVTVCRTTTVHAD